MSEKPSFFAELKRRNVYKVAVACAVLGWLVIQVAATVGPTQFPVPIEKEPRHRLKFENRYVRVFDVLIPPGDTSLFHIHLHDGLSIPLTDARLRDETLAGASEDLMLKRGGVRFAYRSTPVIHRVSNIGVTSFRNIFIEILRSSGLTTSAPSQPAEAGSTIVLENDRLRVRQSLLAPGQSTDRGAYAPRGVLVAASEGEIQINAEGKNATVRFEPGDAQWYEEGTKFSLRNVGSKAFEAVDIELKKP